MTDRPIISTAKDNWIQNRLNDVLPSIPSMTPNEVQAYLYQIGTQWSGRGTAMELGCWLGASAVPLLMGLKEARYDRRFWAFEQWTANEQQVEMTKNSVQLYLGQDVRPLFLQNVTPVYDLVQAVKGRLPGTLGRYDEGPIEICIFDAPKQDPVFIECAQWLIPQFIPGVTVWGLLDYKFYKRHTGDRREAFMAPVRFMAKYGAYFEKIREWDDHVTAGVFFKYRTKINKW